MPRSDAPLRATVKVLRSPLRPSHHRALHQQASQHQRHDLATPDHGVTNVAVLGAGISGLASAYFLSRKLPQAKIVIYEKSSRVGGWVSSTFVDVGSGRIVMEQGPRSLRPNSPSAKVTLQLVGTHQLSGVSCTLI